MQDWTETPEHKAYKEKQWGHYAKQDAQRIARFKTMKHIESYAKIIEHYEQSRGIKNNA
jgi:hypothetical protein